MSTRSLQSSSTVMTVAPRPRPRPLKKHVQPVTPPHVDIPVSAVSAGTLDSSEISPLTPFSSPIEPRIAQDFPRISPEAPSIASSSRTKKSATASGSPRKGGPKSTSGEAWNLSKLGNTVWVLIDVRARVLEPDDLEELESQNKDRIWWPGTITSATAMARPLHVTLANPSAFGVNTTHIFEPCEANILPWEDPTGHIRFEEPVFMNLATLGSMHASPRKKQKLDRGELKRRWHVAVGELTSSSKKHPFSPRKVPTILSPSKKTSKRVETQRQYSLPETIDGSDSDLPEVGTEEFRTYPPSAPSSPTKSAKGATPSQSGSRKGKRKRSEDDDDSDTDIPVVRPRWLPRPPDIAVTVPGELVLGIERAADSLYWPARVLDYLPSDKEHKPDKYNVEFLDGKLQAIPRHWFYIAEEEGFATCKLGEWFSAVIEVRNDDENDAQQVDEHQRFPSPIPTIPPPSAEIFRTLDIREQFTYVKPILTAILNEEYPPAMQRHTNFIVGGSKRKSVVDEAGLRGQMDPRDVELLQRHVSEWCLRDTRRAQIILDEEEVAAPLGSILGLDVLPNDRAASPTVTEIASEPELPPMSSFTTSEGTSSRANIDVSFSAPPRQYGCEAFEALSGVEKGDYCLNVLLPEAIIQILLWRAGKRTCLDILDEMGEAILHAEGLDLLKASDWVNDVMRLRMTAVGQLGKSKRNKAKNGNGEVLYSVTGRPQRGVGAPKSYLE